MLRRTMQTRRYHEWRGLNFGDTPRSATFRHVALSSKHRHRMCCRLWTSICLSVPWLAFHCCPSLTLLTGLQSRPNIHTNPVQAVKRKCWPTSPVRRWVLVVICGVPCTFDNVDHTNFEILAPNIVDSWLLQASVISLPEIQVRVTLLLFPFPFTFSLPFPSPSPSPYLTSPHLTALWLALPLAYLTFGLPYLWLYLYLYFFLLLLALLLP